MDVADGTLDGTYGENGRDRATRLRALVMSRFLPGTGTPGADTATWLGHLCAVAVHALDASGVAVSVLAGSGPPAVLAASDPAASALEDLQLTAMHGPRADALTSRQPVLVSDLDRSAAQRWAGFVPGARDEGVRAVFAFPLQVGAARLGVLEVYRSDPGPLSGEHTATALTLAALALEALLDGQAVAPPGGTPPGVDQALDTHFALYQAQGMVMVDCRIPLADALTRIRAHAFADELPVAEVAADIVAGRLQLPRDGDDPNRAPDRPGRG